MKRIFQTLLLLSLMLVLVDTSYAQSSRNETQYLTVRDDSSTVVIENPSELVFSDGSLDVGLNNEAEITAGGGGGGSDVIWTEDANGIYNTTQSVSVAIGTNNPDNKLHVYENSSTTDGTDGAKIENAGAGDAGIHLKTPGGNWSLGIDNSDSDNLVLSNHANYISNRALVLTNTTRNLGVGTAIGNDPISKLQVYGGDVRLQPTSDADTVGYYWGRASDALNRASITYQVSTGDWMLNTYSTDRLTIDNAGLFDFLQHDLTNVNTIVVDDLIINESLTVPGGAIVAEEAQIGQNLTMVTGANIYLGNNKITDNDELDAQYIKSASITKDKILLTDTSTALRMGDLVNNDDYAQTDQNQTWAAGQTFNEDIIMDSNLTIDDNLTIENGKAVIGDAHISVTVEKPLNLNDPSTTLLWANKTGYTLNITAIYSKSDTDDVAFTLKETAGTDYGSLTTIEAITVATNGTSVFYNDLTSGIDHTTVESGNDIVFDNDAADDPDWVNVLIVGYFSNG